MNEENSMVIGAQEEYDKLCETVTDEDYPPLAYTDEQWNLDLPDLLLVDDVKSSAKLRYSIRQAKYWRDRLLHGDGAKEQAFRAQCYVEHVSDIGTIIVENALDINKITDEQLGVDE